MITATIKKTKEVELLATIDTVTNLVVDYLVVTDEGANEYFTYRKANFRYEQLVEELYD